MTVILRACTGISRVSYWTATRIQSSRQLWQDLQPTHVSLTGRQANLIHHLFTMLSPSLTHLHLDFASFDSDLVPFCNFVDDWPIVFKPCPGLTHLRLSGPALEALSPLDFHRAIDPIVSVLPQALTRFVVNAMSLHDMHTDTALQFRALRADPRVVFVLPIDYSLNAEEELQPYEKQTDGCLNWGSRELVDLGGVFQ